MDVNTNPFRGVALAINIAIPKLSTWLPSLM